MKLSITHPVIFRGTPKGSRNRQLIHAKSTTEIELRDLTDEAADVVSYADGEGSATVVIANGHFYAPVILPDRAERFEALATRTIETETAEWAFRQFEKVDDLARWPRDRFGKESYKSTDRVIALGCPSRADVETVTWDEEGEDLFMKAMEARLVDYVMVAGSLYRKTREPRYYIETILTRQRIDAVYVAIDTGMEPADRLASFGVGRLSDAMAFAERYATSLGAGLHILNGPFTEHGHVSSVDDNLENGLLAVKAAMQNADRALFNDKSGNAERLVYEMPISSIELLRLGKRIVTGKSEDIRSDISAALSGMADFGSDSIFTRDGLHPVALLSDLYDNGNIVIPDFLSKP
jgi:hypothetical protein